MTVLGKADFPPSSTAAGEAELERVVKRLYQEEGLYVERSSEEVQSS